MADRVRRLRADAQRNVAELRAAADEAFRRDGTGASLERIARDAGVAIGTLYSHFPRREALIAAVLRDRHDELFVYAETLLTDRSPGDALAEWVGAVSVHAATYSGLARLFVAGEGDLHDDCARMDAFTTRFADAARRAGSLRADVTDADLTTLMNAAAWIRDTSDPQAERLITATLAGMGPSPETR